MIHFPEAIYLYARENIANLELKELGEYLKKKIKPAAFCLREDFINYYLQKISKENLPEITEKISREWAGAKIRHLNKIVDNPDFLSGEISYEKRRIKERKKINSASLLYDGFLIQNFFLQLIPPEERGLKNLHILLLPELIATYDESDRRYHARAAIYGFPCLISLSGIVEAPAKPREYYLLKREQEVRGDFLPGRLKEKFRERFIDYHDQRLTSVVKGYLLQAFFYRLTGNPFCEKRDCSLFNAHWQEDLIAAQLKEKNDLCEEHEEILKKYPAVRGEDLGGRQ